MRKRRGSIVAGLFLLVFGAAFLIEQLYPNLLSQYFPRDFSWPWYVIGAGAVFLFFAILSGIGGLAIPGTIISSVGAILYYQSITGDWDSWSFAWALVPAAVGLGIILGSIIEGHWHGIRAGLWVLLINLVLFFVFWGAFRQNSPFLATYWPVLVIAFGVLILLQSLFSRKRSV